MTWIRSATGLAAITILLATSVGCRNSCQRVCVQMRELAEECDYTVTDDDFTACLETQREAEREDRQACRDFNGGDVLRQEWGCEDLELFFDPPQSSE